MAGSGFMVLCFGCSLLLLLGTCEESEEVWGASEDTDESRKGKDMVFGLQMEALKEVLEKLRNDKLLPIEKKFSWVPSCDAGELCAVRKGSRIGRLCNCPRGTSCSLYILKCL